MKLEYHFRYFDEEKNNPTLLELQFCTSCSSINYTDSMLVIHDVLINDLILCSSNKSSPKLIKSMRLENLKISEVEFEDGEVWRLLKFDKIIELN